MFRNHTTKSTAGNSPLANLAVPLTFAVMLIPGIHCEPPPPIEPPDPEPEPVCDPESCLEDTQTCSQKSENTCWTTSETHYCTEHGPFCHSDSSFGYQAGICEGDVCVPLECEDTCEQDPAADQFCANGDVVGFQYECVDGACEGELVTIEDCGASSNCVKTDEGAYCEYVGCQDDWAECGAECCPGGCNEAGDGCYWGGETDGGESDGGETDGGETDGGETDGGETDGGGDDGGEDDNCNGAQPEGEECIECPPGSGNYAWGRGCPCDLHCGFPVAANLCLGSASSGCHHDPGYGNGTCFCHRLLK